MGKLTIFISELTVGSIHNLTIGLSENLILKYISLSLAGKASILWIVSEATQTALHEKFPRAKVVQRLAKNFLFGSND